MIDRLQSRAAISPRARAILAPGRQPLDYQELLTQVTSTVAVLNAAGITRGDRVAIVLPNGPEMAVASIAIASACTCAPLNPRYRAAEFAFYLDDLRPRALIVQNGESSEVREVAATRDIPVFELTPSLDDAAGVFHLDTGATASDRPPAFAQADDVALVLHTSGTTSRPKIVPLTIANLCASADHIRTALALSEDDLCLNVMPLFHIHGLVAAVLSSLSAGASVVCTPGFVAPDFFGLLDQFSPTWYTAVPTMHQAIVARAPSHEEAVRRSRLRFIRSSSSALPPRVMAQLEQIFRAPVVEAYGMTEASHQMASNPLPPRTRKPGSVGLPAGSRIVVMGEDGSILPSENDGTAVGDIAVRGPNVTAGYDQNPTANADAFRNGWFRTGDVGRFDADGYLYLTGRSKEIINRGGEKISPREVDEALLEHPAIAEAITFAIPDSRLGEEIGAAVILRRGANVAVTELQASVGHRLADFKVPRRIVFVDAIPTGPTGKLQRIGLAARLGVTEISERGERPPYQAPATPTEEQLARIWSDVLAVSQVGIHDDFMALGGDSILAARVSVAIRATSGKDLALHHFFAAPTLAQLAALVDAQQPTTDLLPVPLPNDGTDLPVSTAQERMWFLAQYESAAAVCVSTVVLRLDGTLDVSALEDALQRIVARHDVIRSTYEMAARGLVQHIGSEPQRLRRETSLEGIDPSALADALQSLADKESQRPFDLTRDYPMRTALIRRAEDEHYLLLSLHHIASDGWSKALYAREVAAWYEQITLGTGSVPAPLSFQYTDYAAWERRQFASRARTQLAFWQKQLEGSPPILPLPTARPRPTHQNVEAGTARRTLSTHVTAGLKALCQRERTTLFMGLLAAFQLLLQRYSGLDDIVVGTPVANRGVPGTESMIGLFMNTLALRTDLSGDPTFAETMARVRDTALRAYAHQDTSFAAVVEAAHPERSSSHSPIYQVMFQLRNFPTPDAEARNLKVSNVFVEPAATLLDLELEAIETTDGVDLHLVYSRALFDVTFADALLTHYEALLASAITAPRQPTSRLSLLSEPERQQLTTAEWNRTERSWPADCLQGVFERVVGQRPEAIAVRCGDTALTYAALNRRANQIANGLAARGLGTGDFVGISLERSVDLLASLLGVLKCGAAYVPLDPRYPVERLQFMVRDSGAQVVIAQPGVASTRGHAAVLITPDELATDDDRNLDSPSSVERLAYLLYTSGTTGEPKGVAVHHGALMNLLHAMHELTGIDATDCWLAATTISFDIAALELFLPLVAGASVEIAPGDVATDGPALCSLLDRCGATFFQATPSGWRLLLGAEWCGNPRLRALCGGEALPLDLAQRLSRKVGRLWNVYGPTETTIWSSACELHADPPIVSIGRPIANTRLYILDRHLEPVAPGLPGELYIGGAGVAQGYWNRPELTASKFLPDPFVTHDAWMYRTGDLARFLPSDEVEFLGRGDEQVKVRGFRIELGEIEATLVRHPSVTTAAVVVREERGGARIIAYVVLRSDEVVPSELRNFLKSWLPQYMLPSHFVAIDVLPLTPAGKIDRKLLAARAVDVSSTVVYTAPRDEWERRVAVVCQEALDSGPIGVTSNLFDLGAHSLLLAGILARLERECRPDSAVSIAALFESPTIEHLASLLRVAAGRAPRFAVLRPAAGRTPLFWVKADPILRLLADRLPDDQPFIGLFLPADHGLPQPYTIEQLAAYHVATIRQQQPRGPYVLGGFSAAGSVALEITRQLESVGEQVGLLVMLDSHSPVKVKEDFTKRMRRHVSQASNMGLGRYAAAKVSAIQRQLGEGIWGWRYNRGGRLPEQSSDELSPEFQALRFAWRRYRPQPVRADTVLFRCSLADAFADPRLGWGDLIANLQIVDVPGDHISMLREPNLGTLVRELSQRLPS